MLLSKTTYVVDIVREAINKYLKGMFYEEMVGRIRYLCIRLPYIKVLYNGKLDFRVKILGTNTVVINRVLGTCILLIKT